MNKVFGLMLLVVGIALIVYGWQAHESVASTVSNAVTGSPTSKTIWLLGGGVIVGGLGLATLLRGRTST